MAANTFDLTSLNGKDLWAAKDVTAYWLYPPTVVKAGGKQPVSYTIKRGERIGKILNYVYFKNGSQLWFAFVAPNKKTYFVRYDEKSFDVKALKAQGVQTVEERAEEKKQDDMSFMDKAIDSGKKIAITVAVGAAVVYIGSKAVTAYIQKK